MEERNLNGQLTSSTRRSHQGMPWKRLGLIFSWLLLNANPSFAAGVDFESEILPILEDRCLYCHGEDEHESGLRLDRRARMLRGGDSGLSAVVAGNPDDSYLLEVVKHLDAGMEMPPDEDKLPENEIALLEKWIKEGAVWPGQMNEVAQDEGSDHWSFQPVLRPDVPLNQEDNPIDAFIGERLKSAGLDFNDPANPRALLRRASIILTGLPPTAEATDAFMKAHAENPAEAYDELVERLVASEHFGERWAQHWLDVIRWAETNGSEANLYRKNAWVYRDYVIRSFNEDKPYDRFVQEQIAGDSLGSGEAMGFLVAGPHVPAATVGQEPSAIRQARADRMDEIMQTLGASVMGLTMGCARCHNHKFDPISIQDYYAMTAVFQDIEFGSRHPEYADGHPLKENARQYWQKISALRNDLRPDGCWEENWGAYREFHFRPVETKAIRIQFKMGYVGLDELEVLGPESAGKNLAAARRGTKVTGFPEKGVETRHPLHRVSDGEYGTMAWRAKQDPEKGKPWVQFDFAGTTRINRLRLSGNREYFYDTDYLEKAASVPRYEFDLSILDQDGNWKPWAGTWAANKKLVDEVHGRKKSLNELQSLIDQLAEEGPRPSFVGRLVEPTETRVLLRGSPENPRGRVKPAGPDVFKGELGLGFDEPGRRRRAEFARWVTRPENPLTARVMVNRIWHHVFGRGIVSTTSDFGAAGDTPTHPELLDWLASEFVDPQFDGHGSSTSVPTHPWSLKSMLRLLVHSKTFQQSSAPTEAGTKEDGGSTLLWRFPPKRLEAEVIRDGILQASGVLNPSIGGRSYRIHNVKKTYAQWQVVNNHGPETWRRMIYQERMRRVDDQMFTAFDFPDCGQVRARRPVSTTPLQALNLLNSDFVIDQSKRIAKRAEETSGGDRDRMIDECYRLLLGRLPSVEDRRACLQLEEEAGLNFVCRALINTNEFAFLP
ncbi:MAG: PSD1 and planctomycete cytochrome C domain-containing protein [Planctomycetota bacterium]